MDFPGRKITFKNQRLLKNFYRIFFLIFRILNLSYCSCNFIIICLSWLIYDFLSKMVYFCMLFGLDILQDQPALKKNLKYFNRLCSNESFVGTPGRILQQNRQNFRKLILSQWSIFIFKFSPGQLIRLSRWLCQKIRKKRWLCHIYFLRPGSIPSVRILINGIYKHRFIL